MEERRHTVVSRRSLVRNRWRGRRPTANQSTGAPERVSILPKDVETCALGACRMVALPDPTSSWVLEQRRERPSPPCLAWVSSCSFFPCRPSIASVRVVAAVTVHPQRGFAKPATPAAPVARVGGGRGGRSGARTRTSVRPQSRGSVFTSLTRVSARVSTRAHLRVASMAPNPEQSQ